MKKSGYTAQEAIITLVIIAIVLTILIPPLLKNTNASQFKTAYKKALSSFKHAITMNVAVDDFDFRVIHNSSTPEDQENKNSFASIITERMEDSQDITETYFNNLTGDQTMVVTGEHKCTSEDMQKDAPNYAACTEAGGVDKTIENAKNEYKISRENFIVYHLKDGTAIGYNKYAQDCRRATQENCVGFIDANGLGGPNRITKCDDKGDWKTSCSVSAEKIHDIYPVVFYNQTIEPATVAGKSILNGLKGNK